MKKTIIFAILAVAAGQVGAETVNGYFRKDGTYVAPYQRSTPNSNRYDNYRSESRGGIQRDEFSSPYGSTNRSNPAYGLYDNDGDGLSNSIDMEPALSDY